MSKWYSVCLVQGVGRAKKRHNHKKTGATISLQQKQHLQERQETNQQRYLPVQASGRLFCFPWLYNSIKP